RAVGAGDGALLIRHKAADGAESLAVYGKGGVQLPTNGVAFNRTIAASVLGRQDAAILRDADLAESGLLALYPFERDRSQVLAAPLPSGSGLVVFLELFDKASGFTEDDRRLVGAAAEVGGDLIRQSIAERQTHRLLFDAVEAALKATSGVQEALA